MKLLLCTFLLLMGHSLASADTTASWSGSSEISFSGTSTLHDWAGKVLAKPFTTAVTFNDSGQPTHIQSTVVVSVDKMDTAEAKRDDNMRKAMRASDFPLISAAIDTPANRIAADGKTPTRLPLTLSLLGKSQQIDATISHWKLQGRRATFDLDFELSMKSSGISVPPVLIFIRVGDPVKVHASVTLTQP